jgi:hypothetical protein
MRGRRTYRQAGKKQRPSAGGWRFEAAAQPSATNVTRFRATEILLKHGAATVLHAEVEDQAGLRD